jgi:hypothetical protein
VLLPGDADTDDLDRVRLLRAGERSLRGGVVVL